MNTILNQDPAAIIANSSARHFAILIVDNHDNRMYWSGNGFNLFDDDRGAFTDVRLWSFRDAGSAYRNALELAQRNSVYADTFLQLVPVSLLSFEAAMANCASLN